MPADTTPQPMRACPVCHGQFPITHHSTTRHTYCSRRCRDIAPPQKQLGQRYRTPSQRWFRCVGLDHLHSVRRL